MEENKPKEANSEGAELTPAEGTEDVSRDKSSEASASEVEYYQKLTGRNDIKSKEDFSKHYDGLKSLVGDQALAKMREKAEAYEKIQNAIEEKPKEQGEKSIDNRISTLEEELKTERFLKQFSEAEPIINSLKAKSKEYGISLQEAYTKPIGSEKFSMQDLLTTKLETEKTKSEEKSISVESKGRIAPEKSSKMSQLAETVRKTDSQIAKQDLVREYLSE
jgi:hypothetical protein